MLSILGPEIALKIFYSYPDIHSGIRQYGRVLERKCYAKGGSIQRVEIPC